MEAKSLRDDAVLIDLESGTNAIINEHDGSREADSVAGQAKSPMDGAWSSISDSDGCGCIQVEEVLHSNNFITISLENSPTKEEAQLDRKSEGEEKGGLVANREAGKPKKKRPKKPPRPPRPQKPSLLDVADEKLACELSELAMLKRERIERMRVLKRMKNAKLTSSNGNWCALIFTILFCLVILLQGVFSRNGPGVRFHGSPESSIASKGGLISVQFYGNHPTISPHGSNSASPSNAEHKPRPKIDGETGRAAG